MPERPSAVELLAALAPALAGRRWYLFGAQAVNLYGFPRMTADVDVTLEIARAELPALVADLRARGFELRVASADEFVRATQVLPFVHGPSGMPLDIVIAGSGLEAMFLERARSVDVGGTEVPVISPADLVVAKILAGRPKDWEDAAGILRERGDRIDVDSVRALLGEIERALGQSDLVPALDRALGETRPAPPRKRPARSTRRKARPRRR